MTQEEILEFNKRCAEFLGCTSQIKSLFEFDEDKETIFYEQFSKPLWWNDTYNHRYGFLSYQRTDYMMYHSDWNWVMQLVEAIHNLDKLSADVMICQSRCKITPRMASDHSVYADVSTYFEKGISGQKEAVVKAINQFLIWYNENKNKN